MHMFPKLQIISSKKNGFYWVFIVLIRNVFLKLRGWLRELEA